MAYLNSIHILLRWSFTEKDKMKIESKFLFLFFVNFEVHRDSLTVYRKDAKLLKICVFA